MTFLSPSLAALPNGRAATAYELKFLLVEAQGREVEDWAARHLTLDPHADPALTNAYRVTGLYFDTSAFAVLHGTPPHKRRKFRLRRYGSEPCVYLEQKVKVGDRVRKRRSRVADVELALLHQAPADPGWAGHWFQRRLAIRALRPACQIVYERVAFVGDVADGLPRLTLDRRLHSAPTDTWGMARVPAARPVLNGQVILELKFHSGLPALFKRLVQNLGLNPSPVSKYRQSMRTWGLDAAARGAG